MTDTLRAQAWALKDRCYDAWRSDPAQVAPAASALQALLADAVDAAERSEISALAAWTAGIVELTRGQMAAAVQCFDAAAAAFGQAGLADPAAQTQVPKIMALSMLGRHDEAAACGTSTRQALRALGNLGAAGRVSQNLGNLALHRDAYAEAVPHLREAADLFAHTGDHDNAVNADISVADALTALGDFDAARDCYARAGGNAALHGLQLPAALVDESVALLDLARGRYREALAGFEAARRRYEALGMPQYLATAEQQLGDAYLELRLLPEALALFDAAVAQFAALALPVEQARALAQRGRALAWLGRSDAAAEAFEAAAALFLAQHNTVGAAGVALARAELALAAGAAAPARAAADAAAQGFASAGQVDGMARAEVVTAMAWLADGDVAAARRGFDATLARARALQQLQVQVRCLTGQGLVAKALGDSSAATTAFEAAIELFEDQRRALPGDEIRAAFLTDHQRPYEERLRLALAGGDAADVLLQLERPRARALDERLASTLDAETAAAQRQRLSWLYRRVQRLHDEADDAAVLGAELRRTEHALLEQVRRARLTAAAPVAAADGWSVAALQAALGDGDALVAYGQQDGALFACVVTRTGVQLLRALAPWADVLVALRALRFQIDALRHGLGPVQRQLPVLEQRAQRRLQEMQALLWTPLQSALAGARRVLVVPPGPLVALPFAAMVQGPGAPQIAIAPSARVALRGLQRTLAVPRSVLALGDSVRLAQAGQEAELVASLFPKGRACTGSAATLAALQAHAADADIVHLACHAVFRSDNPRFSALRLHDCLLSVDLAEVLPLRPGLVVLSACETGLADVAVGDEMVGLVRAFLVAGASRVLASLWPVDDAVTAAFMAAFYGALVQGAAPAAALQLAQAQLRARWPHPHFWAAFALYGGF